MLFNPAPKIPNKPQSLIEDLQENEIKKIADDHYIQLKNKKEGVFYEVTGYSTPKASYYRVTEIPQFQPSPSIDMGGGPLTLIGYKHTSLPLRTKEEEIFNQSIEAYNNKPQVKC